MPCELKADQPCIDLGSRLTSHALDSTAFDSSDSWQHAQGNVGLEICSSSTRNGRRCIRPRCSLSEDIAGRHSWAAVLRVCSVWLGQACAKVIQQRLPVHAFGIHRDEQTLRAWITTYMHSAGALALSVLQALIPCHRL